MQIPLIRLNLDVDRSVPGIYLRFERNECVNRLTGQLISSSDNCAYSQLGDEYMSSRHRPAVSATPLCRMSADSISAVERRCPETLMTSVLALTSTFDQEKDLTIDATLNPNIAMFVTSSTVASVEDSGVRLLKRLDGAYMDV